MNKRIVKKYPTGHADIYCDKEIYEKGDIIETDEGAYIVINYYYTKEGILYEGWSEIEYLKGKRL